MLTQRSQCLGYSAVVGTEKGTPVLSTASYSPPDLIYPLSPLESELYVNIIPILEKQCRLPLSH